MSALAFQVDRENFIIKRQSFSVSDDQKNSVYASATEYRNVARDFSAGTSVLIFPSLIKACMCVRTYDLPRSGSAIFSASLISLEDAGCVISLTAAMSCSSVKFGFSCCCAAACSFFPFFFFVILDTHIYHEQ